MYIASPPCVNGHWIAPRLKDVYPQIAEASHVCEVVAVMTTLPCWATGSCNLLSDQLAASVRLSALVLYGHISAARTQCEQHYSRNALAETPSIHWCLIEYCNNTNGMTLQNLPFFIHGFVKVLSNFFNGIQLIVNILADLSYYTKLKTRSCLTEIPKLAMREGISMSKGDHILLIRRHKSKWPKRDLILRVAVAHWIYIAQSFGLQQRLKML